VKISSAIEALQKRKRSLVGGEGRRRRRDSVGEDQRLPLLSVGLDIGAEGPEGLHQACVAAGETFAAEAINQARRNGEAVDLPSWLGSAWLEGYLVHAMLTRMRQDAATKSFTEGPFAAFIGDDGIARIPATDLARAAESLRW